MSSFIVFTITLSIFDSVGLENAFAKLHYEKVNEKIEYQSKILYIALFQITIPGLLMPNLILSFFLYFSTDLGPNAFQLAFPIW